MIIDIYRLSGTSCMNYLFGASASTYTNMAVQYLEHGPHFIIKDYMSGNYCLQYSFRNCIKLKDIKIEILNRTLSTNGGLYVSNGAFIQAFENCTSLESVELLFNLTSKIDAGTLSNFYQMFNGCTSLKYLKFNTEEKTNAAAFTTKSSGMFYNWMTNCPNTSSCKWVRYGGLTYKSKIVPSNWTIEEEPLPS